MEGLVDTPLDTERPWQADLCQFFTRKKVAELCLRHVTFPKNILSVRLLEPAAGQGAFFLPLLERLVRSCLRQKKNFDVLRPIIRAYEIDAQVAITLRLQTETTLEALGIDGPTARHIARDWIRNEDFLEARPRTRFTHIVGNPPYIRWEAIPGALRESYKARFTSFKQHLTIGLPKLKRRSLTGGPSIRLRTRPITPGRNSSSKGLISVAGAPRGTLSPGVSEFSRKLLRPSQRAKQVMIRRWCR
jgi:adenine-specific DNA-methyltransferase